jgi:glutamate formiminotransferase
MKLIECVPNFSEGKDMNVIKQITDAIESVSGTILLDVDPGAARSEERRVGKECSSRWAPVH